MESFRTTGSCCRQILFDVKDDIISEVRFINGCSGNLQALAKIVVGQNINEVIEKFKGIRCKQNTSCPDQLAKALEEYKTKREKNSK